jgi:hypothetical protein
MTWQLSPEARHASDHLAGVAYDGGGPWSAVVDPITWQMHKLVAILRARFPWVHDIGTVRRDQGVLSSTRGRERSLHAVGRAADVMVPQLAGPHGLALANWLVENAQALGVQLVIWDHSVWQGSRDAAHRLTPYGGANPHTDHVHVELTAAPGAAFAHEAPYLLTAAPRWIGHAEEGDAASALAVLLVIGLVAASLRKGRGRGPGFFHLVGHLV